ncbi:NAD(P)H-binding protein [Kiloniella antarctica]|uniref:NAD(P)H-binding protein n=1 Tax=Kiloniella antarctica TaxID=1550907 RepID=A0ABW5BJG5_9PROT
MYLIADAAGPIGRAVTEQLLGQGQLVRILTTDVECRNLWRGRGAELNEGDPRHASSWNKALEGVNTALLIAPPYSNENGSLKDSTAYHSALIDALSQTKEKPKILFLSALGAKGAHGWASSLGELESELSKLCPDLTVIRPAFLMENLAPALSMAKHHSVFPSFLAEKVAFPMVSQRDLVSVLVAAIVDPIEGHHLMELHGAEPYDLSEIIEAGHNVLTKHIASLSLPEDQWQSIMEDQGLSSESAKLWIAYYQAMNAGYIKPDPKATPLAGETALSDALFQIWKSIRQSERAAIDPERKIHESLG